MGLDCKNYHKNELQIHIWGFDMLTVGSLFSGAGCGDLGLEWAGFEHKWFCEVDDYARKVLELRFPDKKIYGDIQEVDFKSVPDVDILIGGFPCTDISTAGKGAGINGKESSLWKEYKRAISVLRPKYAIIENSPALVTRGLNVVLSDLAEMRYDAEWQIMSAAAFGAPHIRERIWIVAYPSKHFGNVGECSKHPKKREIQREVRREGSFLPDTSSERQQGQGKSFKSMHKKKIRKWETVEFEHGRFRGTWPPEPEICRVVNGSPPPVDELRCLGNGQVPHCTFFIGRLILRAEGLI